MKYLLITISVIGLVVLVLQFDFVFNRTAPRIVSARVIHGFDATTQQQQASTHAKYDSAFNNIWVITKRVVEKKDQEGFTAHLIVIILTTLSTLVSTIGSIKGGANPQSFYLMTVAFLTFIATITGAIESRLSNKKNIAVNTQQKRLTLNADFEKEWANAKDVDKPGVEDKYINNLIRQD